MIIDRTPIAVLLACIALTACGGGGGDAPGPVVDPVTPGQPPVGGRTEPTLAASATAASDVVAFANASVADVVTAGQAGSLPGGALTVQLPSGATTSGTIPCGSGSISYSYTYNAGTFTPQSYSYSYNNCTYGSGSSYYSYNGSAQLTYDFYNSATSYQFTQVYDMTYSYASGGYSTSGTLKSSQTCTYGSGGMQCATTVGNSSISNVSVTTSGTVTTVSRATVKGKTVQVVYSGWVFDSTTGRASAGTVTVSDSNGNSATVQVVSGGYKVTIVYGGSTVVYNVAY